jgi:hypothetical protein
VYFLRAVQLLKSNKRAGGVAQVVQHLPTPEFNPQYYKKTKQNKIRVLLENHGFRIKTFMVRKVASRCLVFIHNRIGLVIGAEVHI